MCIRDSSRDVGAAAHANAMMAVDVVMDAATPHGMEVRVKMVDFQIVYISKFVFDVLAVATTGPMWDALSGGVPPAPWPTPTVAMPQLPLLSMEISNLRIVVPLHSRTSTPSSCPWTSTC